MEGGRDVLLRTQDVADVLGVTDQYIREKGTSFLPSVRVGRFRRYKLSDLLAFIERSTEPIRRDDDKKPQAADRTGAEMGAHDCQLPDKSHGGVCERAVERAAARQT